MPNHLAGATSPYLLQHADNPVDWYEWGEDAFRRARDQDKPVLLSVGYAACHWCHVMAHESFEDQETARLMNELFVCIKVDREERPDVDAIYMDAVQAMSGHGGWPMTVFLTPGGEPFFAGTYFPPEDRHGMPGFRRVLQAVSEAWRDRREQLLSQGQQVVRAISGDGRGTSTDPLTEDLLRQAFEGLRSAYDAEWGGFGSAPKFPQPMTLEFLLRCHQRGWDGALQMATGTLDRMSGGGIYDLMGGGFHRYSTDRIWLVPHFEKMLYDNAQLARVYLHAFQITGHEWHQEVATKTLDYLLREMRHPEGGFFSSQDADIDGIEGKTYVWSWDELVEVVGKEVAEWLGASPEGNWEGTNILWPGNPPGLYAFTPTVPEEHVRSFPAKVEEAMRRLQERRADRPQPATDDKVLAGWNGLAISALAVTGRVLGESKYVDAALASADFVLSVLRREDGRLLRAWRDGRTSGPAFLDDYALMAAACLDLYQTTFDLRWFTEVRALADDLLRLFRDEQGRFFQTGADAERLVIRPRELFDNAVPSGNSAAAEVLQRLALFTGEADYERAGVDALRAVRNLMARAPTGFGTALGALDLYLSPAREVAVIGETEDEATERLIREVWERYLPNVVLAAAGPENDDAAKAIPLLAEKTLVDGKPAAYVCERFVCQRPVTEPSELATQLS